jgi:hypothetical protein
MTINLSSRGCELIIGSQDWTNWIDANSGIQIGYPEYSMGSGLMPVSGTITLKYSIYDTALPSNPNYFLNPNQWKRGQTVTIRIKNTSGALTYLPCSGQLLYLLKPTQRPNRGIDGIATIRLDIGCRLALDNFPPEPNRNVAGVVAGTSTNRNTIIGNILNHISVPHSIDSLPYPIDYPLPKTDGNWVQFAGAIADSAGYYLRCNATGTVVAEPISLIPSTAIEAYVISVDEKIWEPSGDIAEQPLEKLILSGIKQNAIATSGDPRIVEETLALNQISTFPAFQSITTLFTSKRTTTTESLPTANTFIKTETIELPLCQVSTFSAFQSVVTLVPSKRTTTTYLLANGIVYRTVEEIQEPLCQVSSFAAFVSITDLIPSKRTTIDWVKTGDKLWTKTTSVLDAQCRVSSFPAFQSLTNLIPASSFTDDKDTTGAPTSFGDASTNTISEENLVVEVFAIQLAEDPFRQRQRTIDVPYSVSREQLSAYGDRFNRLLTGRSLGFQFGGALTDIALDSTFKPFAQVSVQEGDVIYYPKIDAIQYALNLTECYVLWNGIVVGSAPTVDPEDITRPVTIPFGFFVGELTSEGIVTNTAIVFGAAELVSVGTALNVQVLAVGELTSFGTALSDTPPAPSGLLAKTITYFACEEADGERESSHTDGFSLSYSGSNLISSVAGAVGDALPQSGYFYVRNAANSALEESTFSLNEIGFIAFAFAFKSNSLPLFGDAEIFGNSQYKFICNGGNLILKIIDSTATEYTITYSIGLGSLDPSNVTDWNLVIISIDVTGGEFSLQLNNMAIESDTCPTSGFAAWSGDLKFGLFDNLIPDAGTIDEFGIFDADLDTTDRDTLWNAGDFNTYSTW